MNIDHVHFYVEDVWQWQKWLGHKFRFHLIDCCPSSHILTVIVGTPTIQFRLSSPLSDNSPVAQYLRLHPPGVADLAFRVEDLAAIVRQANQAGAKLLQPIQTRFSNGKIQQTAQIQGWEDLQHTLIQGEAIQTSLPAHLLNDWIGIDHVVLNVAKGDLDRAIDWYERALGLQRRQSFAIQTEYSALCSQVLTHPNGSVQFPINQPASSSSQIQEFLDVNRGAGIQHIALRTAAILPTIASLRQQGVKFLPVPQHYYQQLRQRSGFELTFAEWQAIAEQEVLVDWQPQIPQAVLLQAFTQPIFEQPTFFFELIERRSYQAEQGLKVAEGFGEGNFRALFEAIEREQIKRGSLKVKG
jgi:4-hydroxyphenylpyruvate dioxygenase